MWVVYLLPPDQPMSLGLYVVRLWYGGKATPEYEPFHHLDQARERIQEVGGSYCLDRAPGDPAVVVETWI